MNTLNYISLAVPNIKVAADWFTQVVGPPASGKALFEFDPSVTVKLVECKSSELGLPSIFDLGTLHLCFRVRNIEKVAMAVMKQNRFWFRGVGGARSRSRRCGR